MILQYDMLIVADQPDLYLFGFNLFSMTKFEKGYVGAAECSHFQHVYISRVVLKTSKKLQAQQYLQLALLPHHP